MPNGRLSDAERLDTATTCASHRSDQDGVPYITQPGVSYTYELTVPEGSDGSPMYHSHHNAAKRVGLGQEPARTGDLRRAPPVVTG